MLARLALALILVPGLARSTAAQQPLQPGDTVKLLAPTLTANRYTPLTGVVSRIGPTDLFIVGTGAERAIPLAAIGYSAHSTKWERGQPGPPRIAVAPLISPHGWGLAVSLSF